MSFSSQKAVDYLINKFNDWWLIVDIKTLVVLKC